MALRRSTIWPGCSDGDRAYHRRRPARAHRNSRRRRGRYLEQPALLRAHRASGCCAQRGEGSRARRRDELRMPAAEPQTHRESLPGRATQTRVWFRPRHRDGGARGGGDHLPRFGRAGGAPRRARPRRSSAPDCGHPAGSARGLAGGSRDRDGTGRERGGSESRSRHPRRCGQLPSGCSDLARRRTRADRGRCD